MGLSLVPVTELPPGRRYLRLGTKGRDVQELQKILAGLGFFSGNPHGSYDFLTREAVKEFQRAFHLAADGVVGPKTWRMLGEPGIWNRQCHRVRAGETLAELAVRYGVAPGAWKDPAARRRSKRLLPGDLLLLEERELWLAEEELPEEGVFCTRVLRREPVTVGQTGGPASSPPGPGLSGPGRARARNPFNLPLLKLALPRAANGEEGAAGVVADLRSTGEIGPGRRLHGRIRKELRALRQKSRGEIFWWFTAGHILAQLPKDEEADGILLSVNTGPWCAGGAGSAMGGSWRREVKNLLARYPCTRVVLHFDLRARELRPDGEVRLLPAGAGRTLRLFRPGRGRRLDDGWLQLESGSGEKEYKFFIADRNTLWKIFSGVDRLNLRGVFFTGIQGLERVIMKEAAGFFLVLSQARS
ncbi:MAG: peptidoglycan-binding protein [Firmicutes bacterium]|nr:peptidoglycan-binding protein [Bacillota bacterium]